MMSVAARRIFWTRQGSVLIWIPRGADLAALDDDVPRGRAWQNSAMPSRFSAALSADFLVNAVIDLAFEHLAFAGAATRRCGSHRR
jgi:hypothetical protein